MKPESFPISVEFDKPREKCGVFGIYDPDNPVAEQIFTGLFSLQHRGEEAAGMAISSPNQLQVVGNKGELRDVFKLNPISGIETGHRGIGHVLYATSRSQENGAIAQPLFYEGPKTKRKFALGHNGNLTNFEQFSPLGFKGNDTEALVSLIGEYIDAYDCSTLDALKAVLPAVEGAYSLTIVDNQNLIAVGDPHGFRPLLMGRRGNAVAFSSEGGGLQNMGFDKHRMLKPGEIVVVDAEGRVSTERVLGSAGTPESLCIMEFVYFMREDAEVYGQTVGEQRERMGEQLALEASLEGDLVVGVPGTGLDIANGYSRVSGIPIRKAVIKSQYTGRVFTQPDQELREEKANLKFSVVRSMVKDKRVILIDDSKVRGTNTRTLIKKVRQAGAKEVHFISASPPYIFPCIYGLDTGRPSELIAANMDKEEIREHIGADSLYYLSLDGLVKALDVEGHPFCDACLTGNYPTPVPVQIGKTALFHN